MDMSSFVEELKRKSGQYGAKAWQITEEWHTRNGKARRLSLHDLHELSTAIAESLKAVEVEAISVFWDALHDEADAQYDRRLELLGPIITADDAAFRKTLRDGWSSWILAKKIIDNRRDAILADTQAEPERGPEVGDVIGWNDHDGINVALITNNFFSPLHYLKPRGIKPVVLMRAAEVQRRIEAAKHEEGKNG